MRRSTYPVCVSIVAGVCLAAVTCYPATWRGSSGADQNWSSPANWSDGRSIDGQPAEFDSADADASGRVTNRVDRSVTIRSLASRHAGAVHTTLIPAGTTLTIQGGNGLTVGTVGDAHESAEVTYSIQGEGKLTLFDPLVVNQGVASGHSGVATLDLSGLQSFSLEGAHTPSFLSVGEGVGFNGTGESSPAGVLYLAKNNQVTVSSKITVGFFNPSRPAPTRPSALYLGQHNEIHTVEVGVGYLNSFESRLAFNPALLAGRASGHLPFASFRGQIPNLSPRMSWLIVGANVGKAAIPSVGICDFSGGVVDLLVDTIRVGRGSGNGSRIAGKGTLVFDGGMIDANVVEIGAQSMYEGGDGIGLVQVKAAPDGRTKATLRVNNGIVLGQLQGAPSRGTSGTLEINGGAVWAKSIVSGGGTSRIVVDRGILEVVDGMGSMQAPITALELKEASLRFESPSLPPAVVGTLTTSGGPSRIRLTRFPEIRTFPATLPLLKFATHRGAGKLLVDGLPEGYAAHLAIDDRAGTIGLVVTDGPIPWWQRWWVRALLAAAIAAVVGGIYVARIRTLKAIRRRLEQQVADRTRALTERTEELQRLNVKLAEANQSADAANRELESRVAARTAELEAAVADLRREIAERKRLEQEYRGMFEHAIEGIYRTSIDGRILAANPAMARMLGYRSAEEFIATVTDVSRQLYVSTGERAEFMAQLRERKIVRGFECQLRRLDGAVITAVTNARAEFDPRGQISYYEGTVEDITDRRRLEEQFRHSQKVEMIGQLAGGVAHDFNNLLTVINANAGLVLEAGQLDADSRDGLEQIQAAGMRAAALTRQLLAFSRREAPCPTRVDLNQVIANVAKMLRRLIGENIGLELDLAPEVGPLMADPGMVEQVLVNLAVNARDAMPRGGKLTVATKTITVTEAEASARGLPPGTFACLTMRDTGIGIAPEIRPRIFEPFFTTKEPGQGTGLGLATVARIVQQHRGAIEVESTLGVGTTFHTYWPLHPDGAALPASRGPAAPASSRGCETLLLVEDEGAVRVTAARGLRAFGYKVIEASDGQQAFDLWRQHRSEIALLITDEVMPGQFTGSELATALQTDKPGLAVICTSGYASPSRAPTEGRSATRHLPKPYDVQLLASVVRQLLDASASQG